MAVGGAVTVPAPPPQGIVQSSWSDDALKMCSSYKNLKKC